MAARHTVLPHLCALSRTPFPNTLPQFPFTRQEGCCSRGPSDRSRKRWLSVSVSRMSLRKSMMRLTASSSCQEDNVRSNHHVASRMLRHFELASEFVFPSCGLDSTHNLPDTSVVPEGSLVHALVLRHPVLCVDESVHGLLG